MSEDWKETYRRERERRIAILLGNPIVRGGQGRTAESIRRDGAGVAWTLTLVALVVVLLVLASCRGGAL